MLLGKIKIHEIAKKLNLTSKEVLEIANALKIEAKSHMSGVTEEEAKKIEENFTQKQNKEKKEQKNMPMQLNKNSAICLVKIRFMPLRQTPSHLTHKSK